MKDNYDYDINSLHYCYWNNTEYLSSRYRAKLQINNQGPIKDTD